MNQPAPAPRPPHSGLPPAVLLAGYVVLALLPLGLAVLDDVPVRNRWRAFSSGLAMVGFAALLAQFLLSGRIRALSGRVGIDVLMRFHQLVGWVVLAFLIAHPFLYAVPRLSPEPMDALAAVRRMFASGGLRTGVIAWWLLIALVLWAAFRDRLKVPYETWRLAHGVGAAAIAGFSLHHTLAVGTHSGAPVLATFWMALTALAVGSLAYTYAIKPVIQRRHPYRVVGNRKVAERMWEVTIEPEDGRAIAFEAGQFVWLTLGRSPFGLSENPFSIASAPADRPRLAFVIKESGDFTRRIGTVATGAPAYLDGPHGTFTMAGRRASRLVFIAGGVGFAPVLGILRQLRAERARLPITVIYGNRAASQILYPDELEAMRRELALDLHLVLSEPPPGWTGRTGELTFDVLRAVLAPTDADALYFVCGPGPMMDAVEESLARLGVPTRRIVAGRFKYD